MFELITVQDEVILLPDQLNVATKDHYLQSSLIDRYHNKLIPNLGLCVKVQRIHELPNSVSETNKIVICGEGSVKV